MFAALFCCASSSLIDLSILWVGICPRFSRDCWLPLFVCLFGWVGGCLSVCFSFFSIDPTMLEKLNAFIRGTVSRNQGERPAEFKGEMEGQ